MINFQKEDLYQCDVFIVSYTPEGFDMRYYVIKNRHSKQNFVATKQEFLGILEVSSKPIIVALDLFHPSTRDYLLEKIRRTEMKELLIGGDST